MRYLRWLSGRFRLLVLVLLSSLHVGAGEITFVTWNMGWFPSGGRDRQLSVEEEMARTDLAARTLCEAVDTSGGRRDQVVFCLQEVRDGMVCSNLVAQIDPRRLRMAALSGFRDTYGKPLGQQMTILTTLPIVESGSITWHGEGNLRFGRGFSYAILDLGNEELVAVFCIHLKSNLNPAKDELETQRNIYKREATSRQILDRLRLFKSRYGDRLEKVVVAGDFNTNEDDETFVSEATLRAFYGAHFRNSFTGLRKSSRVTWPSRNGYPDATFDHILYRGFERPVGRKILDTDARGLSDHRPVAVTLR